MAAPGNGTGDGLKRGGRGTEGALGDQGTKRKGSQHDF